MLAYGLAVVFIFTVPWEAAVHLAAIGRLSKALGLFAGLVWLISAIGRGRLRRPDALHTTFFVMLVWSGLTFFWSLDPLQSIGGFVTYTQVFMLLLMIWDLFDRLPAIVTGLQAYVLGAYISSGSIIVNFLTRTPTRFPGHQRFAALGFEVDGIALIVALAAPAAWFLAAGPPGWRRSRIWTLVNYAYVPTALFALVLTGTRGAVLASLPTLAFVFGSIRRAHGARRAISFGSVVVAILLVTAFAPPEMLGRIGSAWDELTGHSDPAGRYGSGEIGGRGATWLESLEALASRPVIGVGLDAHRAAIATGKEAHNIYVSVLTETGIVGFLLFAGVLASIWARIRRLSGWRRRYWFAQLAVLAIGGMSLSLEDSKSVWIFAALAVSSAALEDWVRPSGPGEDATPANRTRAAGSPAG
ncbi:MAG: O-antigen ligase family protein [Actinomycetota bacterium]